MKCAHAKPLVTAGAPAVSRRPWETAGTAASRERPLETAVAPTTRTGRVRVLSHIKISQTQSTQNGYQYQLVMAMHAHANLSCAWAGHNLKYQHLRLSCPASTGPSAPMGPAHSIQTSHISWLDRALATKCGRHRQARCSSGRWLQQSSASDSLPPEVVRCPLRPCGRRTAADERSPISGDDSRPTQNTGFNTEVRTSSSIAGCASLLTRYTRLHRSAPLRAPLAGDRATPS